MIPAGGEGLAVLLKSRGRAPANVARELVEQNDQRQPPTWRLLPVFQLAAHRGLEGRSKMLPALAIEGRTAPEPDAIAPRKCLRAIGGIREPEVEHVAGVGDAFCCLYRHGVNR